MNTDLAKKLVKHWIEDLSSEDLQSFLVFLVENDYRLNTVSYEYWLKMHRSSTTHH